MAVRLVGSVPWVLYIMKGLRNLGSGTQGAPPRGLQDLRGCPTATAWQPHTRLRICSAHVHCTVSTLNVVAACVALLTMQAAVVADSPFYKLLIGRILGYAEPNIKHHVLVSATKAAAAAVLLLPAVLDRPGSASGRAASYM